MSESDKARFWAKVNKQEGEDACWLWTASTHAFGYGQFYLKGRGPVSAPRVSFEIKNGVIPAGKCVLHKCDNPACVRPPHLFLGTHADNIHDKCSKGRTSSRANGNHRCQTRPETIDRGESHHHSKLTEADVKEIRSRYAAGGENQYDMAVEFSVPQPEISRVINRKRWAHV